MCVTALPAYYRFVELHEPTLVADPVEAFRALSRLPGEVVLTRSLADIYVYGVEPLPGGELLLTAERDARPVLVQVDRDGKPMAVTEVARRYLGISATARHGRRAKVIVYDTNVGDEARLETWTLPVQGAERVDAVPLPLGRRVLRVYDIGVAPFQEGEAMVVIALVQEDEDGPCREQALLLLPHADAPGRARALPGMSARNELRSVCLFGGADGALYALACRRFWLKDEAFLFRVWPDEALLAQHAFECRGADFQQVGAAVTDSGALSLACVYRHRRDSDGITYHIERFRPG